MAHELKTGGAAPAILRNSELDLDVVQQARVDLAACFRMAARLGLQEGICNHFSAMVPGRDDLFLVNPYGLAFEEITASSLLVCDFNGHVVAGEGKPEATAFYIHARLHLKLPRAKAAFHTHMPYATALSMIEGEPLAYAGQTSLKFYGRTAVDSDYNGLALGEREGDRIAAAMGKAAAAAAAGGGAGAAGAASTSIAAVGRGRKGAAAAAAGKKGDKAGAEAPEAPAQVQ